MGGLSGPEAELVARAGLPFEAIHGAGVHGVGWRRLPGNALALVRGFFQAFGLVRRFRPQALLVTGGYIAVPVALAAWLQRVPVFVYLPDLEPGLALRVVGWLARRVALTAEESRRYFDSRRAVVTGYPVRRELAQASAAGRAEARAQLGLDAGLPLLLVTGGSRGARSLNRALFAALPELLPDCQVLHLTGQLDWEVAVPLGQALPAELRARYQARPYLHEMELALAAADLVVSRAGASALGEYPLFGLPAILVPYPYAWRYQKVNADYLAARGAALRLEDGELAARLVPEVRALLRDPERLARMRAAARSAARPEAARQIAQELLAVMQAGA